MVDALEENVMKDILSMGLEEKKNVYVPSYSFPPWGFISETTIYTTNICNNKWSRKCTVCVSESKSVQICLKRVYICLKLNLWVQLVLCFGCTTKLQVLLWPSSSKGTNRSHAQAEGHMWPALDSNSIFFFPVTENVNGTCHSGRVFRSDVIWKWWANIVRLHRIQKGHSILPACKHWDQTSAQFLQRLSPCQPGCWVT